MWIEFDRRCGVSAILNGGRSGYIEMTGRFLLKPNARNTNKSARYLHISYAFICPEWNGDRTVIERLFVYGTLGPDRPNEHVLDAIGGSWKPATVTGTLRLEGWGAELGYPGIDLDEHGDEVEGFIFTSENLSNHWAALDEFEGEAYKRVLAKVKFEDGSIANAHIYTLRSS
jgi:gamma-glutamylcyclotransferase (GGCT)/AIG2-like uncharacterized protein YtfP